LLVEGAENARRWDPLICGQVLTAVTISAPPHIALKTSPTPASLLYNSTVKSL